MSGHSKWHSIKHKKAAVDAKRGKIFTRLIKEISIAARLGGGDSDANPRLRTAILKAKESNMPNDNIERAIKKGTGELEGVNYEELVYEAFGPDGVAIIMDMMTDNRNRTAAEIRKLLSKHGGTLAESGAVAWNFEKKGIITIDANAYEEDKVMEIALEAGALDLEREDDALTVTTEVDTFEDVKEAIRAAGIKIDSDEISRIPTNTVKLSEARANKVINLLEILEDHDDVQNLAANFEVEE